MKRLILTLLGMTSGLALTSLSHASLNSVAIEDRSPQFPLTGGTGSVLTISPDVVIEKDFTSLGEIPIIVSSQANPRDGMDTYKFIERIRNNTGIDWTDFHLEVGLIDANQNLMVDFLNPASPTNSFNFMTMTGALWLFGNVPTGSIFTLEFDLKITDQPALSSLFGIREHPTVGGVPEPASIIAWILLGICLTGTVWLKKRFAAFPSP